MTTAWTLVLSCALVFARPFKHIYLKRSGGDKAGCAERQRWIILFTLFAAALIWVDFIRSRRSYIFNLATSPPRSSRLDRSDDFMPTEPIPDLYMRHTRPWRKYVDLQYRKKGESLTGEESHNRFLVSSAGDDVGDGLGHRFLVVNYERILAHELNLTYIHRQARYGSLTSFDHDAVDRFFGWTRPGFPMLSRDSFLSLVCQKRGQKNVRRHCLEEMVFCKRLNRNKFVSHLVEIPAHVALCLKERSGHKICSQLLQDFTQRHPKPNTLFYTPTSLCSWKLYWSNQRITRSWFYNQYWAARRVTRLDARYINIALHIRRGDFLKLRYRTTIPDAIYAKAVRRIVSIVSEEELSDESRKVSLDLKFRLHIFSEGKLNPQVSHPLIRYLVTNGFLVGIHDVNNYGTQYVSELGEEMKENYWDDLLGNHPRVTCDLHVSENTLESLEQMIAADILIGSASALSVHIAAQLSRGIPFLPTDPPYSLNSSKTIRWDPSGAGIEGDGRHSNIPPDTFFDTEQFRRIWREYRVHIGADKVPLGLSHSHSGG